mmetsp:Transcript_90511/g.173535  ORF Transcript_90511/g.173535 Transcript_90511/m.173535 type:complete len:226 (-) Transcript_90511:104-781(-)
MPDAEVAHRLADHQRALPVHLALRDWLRIFGDLSLLRHLPHSRAEEQKKHGYQERIENVPDLGILHIPHQDCLDEHVDAEKAPCGRLDLDKVRHQKSALQRQILVERKPVPQKNAHIVFLALGTTSTGPLFVTVSATNFWATPDQQQKRLKFSVEKIPRTSPLLQRCEEIRSESDEASHLLFSLGIHTLHFIHVHGIQSDLVCGDDVLVGGLPANLCFPRAPRHQ